MLVALRKTLLTLENMPTQYVCVGNKGTLHIEEDHGARWL